MGIRSLVCVRVALRRAVRPLSRAGNVRYLVVERRSVFAEILLFTQQQSVVGGQNDPSVPPKVEAIKHVQQLTQVVITGADQCVVVAAQLLQQVGVHIGTAIARPIEYLAAQRFRVVA